MRWLINYIRSCFCKHEWELLDQIKVFDQDKSMKVPDHYEWIYRCKKCGYCNKIKSGN